MRCFRLLTISSVSLFVFISYVFGCDIQLKNRVVVDKNRVFLNDVCIKCPQSLYGLAIAISPAISQTLTLHKNYIESALRNKGYKFTLCGGNITIKRKRFLITKKDVLHLTGLKHILFISKMPVALPYYKYKLKIKNVRQNNKYLWINIAAVKNGETYRSIGISAKISKSTLVPVAARDIRYGSVIKRSDIKFINAGYVSQTAVTSLNVITGTIAASNIKKNSFFTLSNTKKRKLVKYGDLLSVCVEIGNVKIHTTAKALQGGYNNDIIKIMYPRSKRVVSAVIIGSKKVFVE